MANEASKPNSACNSNGEANVLEEPRRVDNIYGYLYAKSLYGKDFDFHKSHRFKEPTKSYDFFYGNAPLVYDNGRNMKTKFHQR